MNKAFYFQHDYNAATDAKILFLRQQLGMEGYGIYWFIVEYLASAGGILPINIIPILAMQSHTQESKVEAVIKGYNLFEVTDTHFFSHRLNRHIFLRKKLSEEGLKGVKAREKKKQLQATHEAPHDATHDGPHHQRKGKERIGKDRIGEDRIEYPHLDHEFSVDHCKALALNDQTWVMNSKATEALLTKFNQYLLGQGIEKKHIADYKKHFYNWLKKNPSEAPKKLVFK